MTDAAARPDADAGLHVALLRGVNVGGKNRLPMAEFARLCASVGGRDVRTFLQSGNVVYRAAPALADAVGTALRAALAAELGLDVPVITRDAAAFRTALARNPFIAAGADPATVFVAFLASAPEAPRVAALDASRSPGDRFVVDGAEVHLHLPHGVGRSRLTNAWFDAQLRTTSTVRNWNTVRALAEMMS